ncbi:MAG: 30S ribosomal protein S3 [Nitrosopumilaceae archaeon]
MSAVKNVIKDNYNMMLLKDYLREKIKDAGFSDVEISKTPTGTRIVLHVTRPGIVIGRKGSGIRELTEKLGSEFGLKNPQISVSEIPKPELAPSVMCNRLASHIERGTAFRRATMWTLQQIMEGGAMGVQITISGKLRGDRSAFEKHSLGVLPRAGHHADVIVAEDIAHVRTPMGLIGIRIRIASKEKVIPEFEFKEKPSKEKTKPEVEIPKEAKLIEAIPKIEAKTESEQIELESKHVEKLETLEEEEEKLK